MSCHDHVDDTMSPRDEIIMDAICLNTIGYADIVDFNKKPHRRKLEFLRQKFTDAMSACNFDWDALADDCGFREAVCLACCFGMRFRGDRPASEPDDVDLELP